MVGRVAAPRVANGQQGRPCREWSAGEVAAPRVAQPVFSPALPAHTTFHDPDTPVGRLPEHPGHDALGPAVVNPAVVNPKAPRPACVE
jgi:hypothetical protein